MNKALGYVALLLFLTAVGCAVVALATSYWAVHDNGDNFIGFFQKCGRPPGGVVLCSNNFDKDHRDTYKDDEWFLSAVGTHCAGVLLGFIATVLWFAALCSRSGGLRGGAICCGTLACAGFLIAVILWKFQYIGHDRHKMAFMNYKEGWSFWVAVVDVALSGIAVILMIAAAISHRK